MSVTSFMPRDILEQADIYHVPTTDGAVSYAGSADESNITVGLLPLTAHRKALLGLDVVGTFELFADDNVDIREGDKVVIDPDDAATEYRVHNVDVHDYGGHPHKNCVIVPVEA